jgi:GntR family transcriptional regulator of arabinose operon
VSKADEVYYWLKEQFASDAIPVGEKLPSEPELARRFSSSRPPVRQALARLIHEGLVESQQGKGTFRKGRDVASVASSDIAVILPNLSDYIYPELVEAAGAAIRERGFHALFACSEGSLSIEADILLKLLERSPRGLIISPICPSPREPSPNQSLLLTIKSAGIPILVLDHEWSPLSSLYLDDYEAGREAARYFYDRGHRYCGLCWKAGHRPFYFRAQGYIDELKGLSSLGDPVQFRELSLPAGPEEASSVLISAFLKEAAPKASHPLALFCANDSMALAIRRIALELGRQIPQDLSLIGFDDSPLVRIKEIDLTSFRYPSRYLGVRAVELLFDHITNRALSPQVTIKIKPPLVERSSVRSIEKDTAPAKEHP